MPRWMRAVMLGQFVSSAGGLAWIYLTLYLVSARGLEPGQAGLVAAGYGVGTLVGNLTGGWFGDRFGLRRSLLAAQLGGAAFCAALPVTPVPALLVVGTLTGLIGSASRPLMSALVVHALPPDRRRTAVALSRTASNAGFVIGPPLGALLATNHFEYIFYADALTSLVLAFVVWARVTPASGAPTTRPPRPSPASAPDEGRPARGASPRPARLWPALRADGRLILLLGAVLAVDTVYRLLYTALPLALRDAGHKPVLYGSLIAANALIIVLAEAPLSVVLGKQRATSVVAAGFALVGLGWWVFGLAPAISAAAVSAAGATVAVAIVATTVITAGEMLYKPTATAHFADRAPEGLVGRYQSLYAGASIGGTMLSPLVGIALYERSPGLLWTAAGVVAVAAGLAVSIKDGPVRRRRDAEVPAEVPAGGN